MTNDDAEVGGSTLWRSLADLVVYAPIGLTLDAQDLAPDLARRGRQHTAAARRIGEFAVKAGMRRLDDLVAALDPSPSQGSGTATGGDAASPEPVTALPDAAPGPVADSATDEPVAAPMGVTAPRDAASPADGTVELAIVDYDLLAASQVVKRLDGLDADQLDAIRRHEEAGRGRRTILHKIARLQS